MVRFVPLKREVALKLDGIKEHFSDEDLEEVEFLLKKHKARLSEDGFDTSDEFWEASTYTILASNVQDAYVQAKVDYYNKRLVDAGRKRIFSEFSAVAKDKIIGLIAPNIISRDHVKLAGLLQLFAKEKVHILLLGDPSTGKTVILRSISDLAPISSFGLGSGASKAGLTLTVSGKEIVKGILPLADGGVACIDELNLMRNQDLAGLLNAMEKGFITYDKGNHHLTVDARVKVFASANPAGDKFVGRSMEVLRQQMPFDDALVSRFHLIFLMRKPDAKEFLKISEKIVRGARDNDIYEGDAEFVKEYVRYALEKEVYFDKKLADDVQAFVAALKRDEDRFLMEVSPRMVVGLINLAKASARIRLAEKVERADLDQAIKVLHSALYIRQEELDK